MQNAKLPNALKNISLLSKAQYFIIFNHSWVLQKSEKNQFEQLGEGALPLTNMIWAKILNIYKPTSSLLMQVERIE